MSNYKPFYRNNLIEIDYPNQSSCEFNYPSLDGDTFLSMQNQLYLKLITIRNI